MTESEVIAEQAKGNSCFLIKIGMFYHAYNEGAYALAKITGYKVKTKQRKRLGTIYVLGFPISQLPKIITKIKENNGNITRNTDDVVEFEGIDTSVTSVEVVAAENTYVESEKYDVKEMVLRELREYDLSNSSPMDAINFIAKLKRKLQRKD
jgi:DNA mismatch repair ATPase MutS